MNFRPRSQIGVLVLAISASAAGTGCGSDSSDTGSSFAVADCSAEPRHSGDATYYAANGSGNCSFDPSPNDLRVAAMNHVDYDESNACGACVRVFGPLGEVTVRIVDRCPECPQGDIDLSREAFAEVAEVSRGRVQVEWQYVPCDVDGAVKYRFKEGSSQYWTAVQIRNHRSAIAKLEYEKSGAFVDVPREQYNYFVEAGGMGPGPYTFRVTDVYGNAIIDERIAFAEAREVSGQAQLPVCR